MGDRYSDFIASKSVAAESIGIEVSDAQLCSALKPFQRDIVRWALRRGRAALFEGTGLGKTLQQLVWADVVADHERTPVLIVTPLAVAEQTVREAAKFGIGGVHLTHRTAREERDERHISPLQLTVIRRCVDLWSNPCDVVFSPFAGIGSELYVAVEMGRKALGAELKESYYRQAVANLTAQGRNVGELFTASA